MTRRAAKLVSVSIMVLVFAACGRDESPQPAPPAAAPKVEAPPGTPPIPTTIPANVYPEDLTVDAEREPGVRAKAKELNAVTPQDMKNLKIGDEVVILVRGDRGGGTIYGSGPYTLDSSLRKAVVHAGAVGDKQLGIVRVKVMKHEGEHPSVPANGITPTKWGAYHTSYTLEAIDVP